MNKVEVNSRGTNKNIKAHILSDERMREIGFTDYNPNSWYYMKGLDKDITFNVTIPKDGSDICVVVLDENFLQPYDYQYMLEKNPDNQYALGIKIKTEECMRYMQNSGVLSGHEYGDYI